MKLDREKLRRLVEESKSWPQWMFAELGANSPSRIEPYMRKEVDKSKSVKRMARNVIGSPSSTRVIPADKKKKLELEKVRNKYQDYAEEFYVK